VTLDDSNWRQFITLALAHDQTFRAYKTLGDGSRDTTTPRADRGEKVVIPAGKLDTPENWRTCFDVSADRRTRRLSVRTSRRSGGMKYDENLEKAFKKFSHEIGLLPKQAAAGYKFWNDLMTRAHQSIAKGKDDMYAKTEQTLRTELGGKYDDFVKGANGVLKMSGASPQEIAAFADEFGNNPLVIKVMGNIAKMISEDLLIRGGKPSWEMTTEDAKKKCRRLSKNEQEQSAITRPLQRGTSSAQLAVEEVERCQTLRWRGDRRKGQVNTNPPREARPCGSGEEKGNLKRG
jgi:hypothetical protein